MKTFLRQNPLINPVLGIRIQKEKGTEVISRVRPLNKKIKTHEKVDESHIHIGDEVDQKTNL